MNERPVIIVGTGRCGSTLLSQMVRRHPDLLSVSEVFSFATDLGARIGRAFPVEPVSGQEFWRILAEPQPRQSILLANNRQMDEVVYPWSRGRYGPHELPPIMQGMVPHLDDDHPDHLFDAIEAEVMAKPPAPIGTHYQELFAWLADRFGKRQWVERSGGSLRVVERLTEAFPEAAIVHLVRDGRDTAISMSRHIGFRMAILCGLQTESLGLDPYESDDRTDEADLSDELADTLPENFSAEAFDRFELPPALCGHYWSGEIISGLKALEKVPEESVLTLRYEDILADPKVALDRFACFTGTSLPAPWLSEASQLVRNVQPRWPQLPLNEQHDLAEACRPGFDALNQHNLTWS